MSASVANPRHLARTAGENTRRGYAVLVFAVAATLVIYSPLAAAATTYFVRATGDDAADGLTPATARASIRPTARMLQNPGDRLIVGPGTYHEGNIMPRGSGTPAAPIVLHADVTGELTGDPAGSVVIVPPNRFDSSTGIIVYGRHDLIIEGFDVDGASDAGIQVRRHSRTRVESFNVTIRDNRIRSGRGRGIHTTSVGEVTITGNTISTIRGAGIYALGAQPGAHVIIDGNIIERCGTGIALWEVNAVIADNDLQRNGQGVGIVNGGQVDLLRNEIRSTGRALRGYASKLTIVENILERGVQITSRGELDLTGNVFATLDVGLEARSQDDLRLIGNRLPRTIAGSAQGHLMAAQNRGVWLEGYGRTMAITDNAFDAQLDVGGQEEADLTRNRAASLQIGATNVIIRDNEISRRARISAAGAFVNGNQFGSMVLYHRSWFPGDGTESIVIENNTSGDVIRVGEWVEPVPHAIVAHNRVGGVLRLFAQSALEVRDNDARGIACAFTGPDADLILSDNRSMHAVADGLVVIGAAHATIENNVASDNTDGGLATRASRHLDIVENTFAANQGGGLSLRAPVAGDCNDDLAVSVDEITMIVRIALSTASLATCSAADLDGDDSVTVDEIMQALEVVFGRQELSPPRVTIERNRIEDNGRFGIDVRTAGALVARQNRILRNAGVGLSVRASGGQENVAVVGNVFGSAGAEGLLLQGTRGAQLRNNTIFSNREAGILLRNAPRTAVINNLIYANGDDGISVGVGADAPAPEVMLANNTIYANAGWGVTMGTAGVPSKGTVVLNNIIDGNLRGGVAAEAESGAHLTRDFNLNNDSDYATVPDSATDFEGDPRFVAAAGPDGILGGAGYADDDLHLRAGTPVSAAINAGSAPAATLGITGSAVAGQPSDTGVVDVGFHYGASDVAAAPRIKLAE